MNNHHTDHFFKLKNKNNTDEEYNICVDVWKDNNMNTVKDFLEWNNDRFRFV